MPCYDSRSDDERRRLERLAGVLKQVWIDTFVKIPEFKDVVEQHALGKEAKLLCKMGDVLTKNPALMSPPSVHHVLLKAFYENWFTPHRTEELETIQSRLQSCVDDLQTVLRYVQGTVLSPYGVQTWNCFKKRYQRLVEDTDWMELLQEHGGQLKQTWETIVAADLELQTALDEKKLTFHDQSE